MRTIIERLGEKGCDAVILGCTELPLLIEQSDSPLPILDSTRLLARAALRLAVTGTKVCVDSGGAGDPGRVPHGGNP